MSKINEKLAKLESLRQELKKKAIIVLIIFGLLTVIGLVLFFLSIFSFDGQLIDLFLVGFIILVIGISGLIIGLNLINKKLREKFAAEFNHNYLKDIYGDNFQTFPTKGLAYQYLSQSGVLTKPNDFKSKNLFISDYKGVKIEGADYTASYVHYVSDGKGNSRRVTNTYSGKTYVFTFPRQFSQYFCCFEKGSKTELYKSPSRKSKVDFESVDFNDKFESFTSSQTFAFYLMTPQVQLSLLEFDAAVESKIVFAFIEDKLFIFMNEYRSKAKVDVFTKIDENLLKNYILELTIPLKLIDDFDIDKNKFLDDNLK